MITGQGNPHFIIIVISQYIVQVLYALTAFVIAFILALTVHIYYIHVLLWLYT